MWKPIILMVVAGVAVGLAWPSGDRGVDAAAVEAVGSEGGRETILEREGNGHFYAHAKINGQVVRFLVDTGASSVALTVKDAERIGVPFSRDSFTYVGEGAAGPVRGQLVTIPKVELDGKTVTNVRGVVLEGSELSLLGQSFLSRVGEVHMRGERMIIR